MQKEGTSILEVGTGKAFTESDSRGHASDHPNAGLDDATLNIWEFRELLVDGGSGNIGIISGITEVVLSRLGELVII